MNIRGIVAAIVTLLTVLTAFSALPTVQVKADASSGNTLYIAMQQDMTDFNTWNLGSNSVWKANVIGFGFEGLVSLDYNMNPIPLLAQSYTFYLNNLTYIFHLRHNVTFNDGLSTMTADDVLFMYNHSRSGTTLSSNVINAFDGNNDGVVSPAEISAGVIKVDDYTVKMVLPKPDGQFLTTTAGVYIMPKRIWEHHLVGDLLDTSWSDPSSTVSTGPFKYAGGVAGSYRIMDKWTGYWGKNFTTPAGYHTYPPNIDHLYYKIYASLDTAILALQSGAVDYIDWAITPGRVPGLQSDPNIGLSYQPENGYYYLAFNQKNDPMGNVSFRRAVSHLIDKAQIVNVYLGGYGSQGSASEPPFWGNDWYNSSADTYPYDIAQANAILNQSGFLDVNGDGLRELPNGLPMDKITILTPPADYDPIRIRAGELIAQNMRAVGINAVAKAIDFDTLVAKLQSMDFQMLIIGWSLTGDPVGNVFDILGPLATSNTFGFWSEANPNPFYSSLGGVVTRADASTQAAADQVITLGNKARQNFSIQAQETYTKWAEGVIAHYVPVNVLYYRVNVEAFRNAWQGWIPFLGTMLQSGANIYCLSNLHLAGAGAIVGATQSVNAGITLPGNVLIGKTIRANVLAIDNKGIPISGAGVTVSVAGTVGASTVTVPTAQATGTTDANGTYSFNVTGATTGYSYVNATVSKGGVSSIASATVKSSAAYPKVLGLTITPGNLVLAPTEETNVMATVTDESGKAVAGATVAVDPHLIGFGKMKDNVNSLTTDAGGNANFTYQAPTMTQFNELSLNTHLTLTLSFNATKLGYSQAGAASVFPLIFNANPSTWYLTRVVSVSPSPALSASVNTTSIIIEALNETGVAQANQRLNVTYSDKSILVAPVDHVVTDGLGQATITVKVKALTATTAFKVEVQNLTVINSVAATVTVTYVNVAPAVPMFAGYITYLDPSSNPEPFMAWPSAAMGSITATVHLWNDTGALTNNVPLSIVVSGTSAGDLAWSDLISYSSNFDGWGLVVASNADNSNYITGGPFNTAFDRANWLDNNLDNAGNIGFDWGAMTGTNITNGVMDIPIYGQDVAASDLISQVIIVPNGIGFFNTTSYSYEIDGNTSLASDYVVQRAYEVTQTSMDMRDASGKLKPVLKAKQVGFDSTKVNGYAKDSSNNTVEGATVQDFQVYRYYARATDFVIVPYGSTPFRPGSTTTDADGVGTMTLLSLANNMIGTTWSGFVVPQSTIAAIVDCKASVSGTVAMFAAQQVVMVAQQDLLSFDPILTVSGVGTNILVTAHVTDSAGKALTSIPVTVSVSGGATVNNPTLATDSNGVAVFSIDTSKMQGVNAAFIKVTGAAGGPGFMIAGATLALAVNNPGPTISVGSPLGADVLADNVTLNAVVYDAIGVETVKVTLDSGTSVTLTGTAGEVSWTVAHSFGALKKGDHTMVINATDALGISTEKSVTFTVVKKSTTDMLAWALAAVGWILFAAVAVWMIMKMRGPKPEPLSPKMDEPEPMKEEPEPKM